MNEAHDLTPSALGAFTVPCEGDLPPTPGTVDMDAIVDALVALHASGLQLTEMGLDIVRGQERAMLEKE